MNELKWDFPTAAVSDDALGSAVEWSLSKRGEDDGFFVWTKQKNQLVNYPAVLDLVNNGQAVHLYGKLKGRMTRGGVVLSLGANLYDVVDFLWLNKNIVRAVCAVLNDTELTRRWVSELGSERLGGFSHLGNIDDDLGPVLRQVLVDTTNQVNHNNPIQGRGTEKDTVVTRLKDLHRDGYSMNPVSFGAWAAANGWRGANSSTLECYVEMVEKGHPPKLTD